MLPVPSRKTQEEPRNRSPAQKSTNSTRKRAAAKNGRTNKIRENARQKFKKTPSKVSTAATGHSLQQGYQPARPRPQSKAQYDANDRKERRD